MSRRFPIWSICMMVLLAGCGGQRPLEVNTQPQPAANPRPAVATQPQPAATTPLAVAPAVERRASDAVHWSLPSGGGRIFLGQKLVTFPDGSRTLQALDQSGAVLWSTARQDDVNDLIVRSDGAQALIVSSAALTWMDLVNGEHIGQVPGLSPALGQFIWHSDWLLVGVVMYKAPVDPKSPGKSEDHVEWSLYHARRADRTWDKIIPLVQRGGFGADLSADGTVALVESKDVYAATMFVQGRQTQTFKASAAFARFLLAASGKYVFVLDQGTLVTYTADGVETARKPVGTVKDVTIWGDRVVVSDASGFSVYDVSGRQVLNQTRFAGRQQYNGKYLLVATGGQTGLVDDTGKVIASYPHPLDSMNMTPDGKWVYSFSPTVIDAYPVPS